MRRTHEFRHNYLVAALPKRGRKQSENREYLQSADYHVRAENKLAEPRESTEIAHRTDNIYSGSDVIHARYNRSYIGREAKIID